jgi:hypothetical protein
MGAGKLYHFQLRVECTLFCNLQSRERTHAVLVIGLYELLDNPTTNVPNSLSHPGPRTLVMICNLRGQARTIINKICYVLSLDMRIDYSTVLECVMCPTTRGHDTYFFQTNFFFGVLTPLSAIFLPYHGDQF